MPSVFAFKQPAPKLSQRKARYERRVELQRRSTEVPDLDIGSEVEVGSSGAERVDAMNNDEETQHFQHKNTGCDLVTTFGIEMFIANDKAVQFYTGFDNYDHFCLFFNILGPAVNELQYKCSLLEPRDQLFLTLMKLRRAKEFKELSILFNIGESTASTIFYTWINFMYFQLKEINIWPSREVINETMPKQFKRQFPQTRVVLDATEVPVEKPSNVSIQSCTYSAYKNRNTLKTMIGVTPRGMVSYISESYGGSTSDRQIIERSQLFNNSKKFFSPSDSIMADRGIMVQDLFASHDVYVNTPTLLKGKSQLNPEEVVKDRRIASKRIHVERVIGLGKTYKILKSVIPQQHIELGSRIIYVCFMLINFRECVVHRLA